MACIRDHQGYRHTADIEDVAFGEADIEPFTTEYVLAVEGCMTIIGYLDSGRGDSAVRDYGEQHSVCGDCQMGRAHLTNYVYLNTSATKPIVPVTCPSQSTVISALNSP